MPRSPSSICWPDGKDFAFTIFDDTECGAVENNNAIYSFLRDLNMRTTKTVWPVAGPGEADIPGSTCDEPEYLELCLRLQKEGFEIAFHNATYHTAERELTRRAFDRFRDLFGHDPHTMANHSTNREGIYWGPARLSGWRRLLYRLPQRGERFRGHIEGDPLYWGDLCRDRVRYVRNFTYWDLNTTAVVPQMPYYDPQRPLVNQWFSASEAADIEAFNRCVTRKTVDKLVAERGGCILYTHFGKEFHDYAVKGQLDPKFMDTMEYIASKNGWFVPVSTLLDFLARQQPKPYILSDAERSSLENAWLVSQAAHVWRRLFSS